MGLQYVQPEEQISELHSAAAKTAAAAAASAPTPGALGPCIVPPQAVPSSVQGRGARVPPSQQALILIRIPLLPDLEQHQHTWQWKTLLSILPSAHMDLHPLLRISVSTVMYCTYLYSTLLYSTLLCSTLLYFALLYSTLLYSALLL